LVLKNKSTNTARDGGMPVALAGAMAAAKAAIPGGKIAAKRERKGQATTVRAKKPGRRRTESQRSSCARGKLEASRGQSWPRVPPCPHRGSNLWPPGRQGSAVAAALSDSGFPSSAPRCTSTNSIGLFAQHARRLELARGWTAPLLDGRALRGLGGCGRGRATRAARRRVRRPAAAAAASTAGARVQVRPRGRVA
jgi:hypothetical protein